MPTPPDKIRGRLLQGCIAVETIRFTGETVRPFPKFHKNRLLQKKQKLQAVFFVPQTPPGAFFVQNFRAKFKEFLLPGAAAIMREMV